MFRDLLRKKLSEREIALVPSSFDIVGSREKAVAIIEIPRELKKKQKIIANALMKQHKNVVTVLNKESPRKGRYRTRKLKLIKGKRNIEVMHMESGCRFLLDPKKVYFSPREGTERLRIASQVKKKENVMIFFAGIGPFAVVIGKKAKPNKIIGIEVNPIAVKYFKENIRLNKLENIETVRGDVKKQAKRFYGKCNRVLMPLPESSMDYLEEAIKCLSCGIIHCYCFSEEDEISGKKEKIASTAKKMKKKIKFISVSRVLPYGPRIWKYRIDFRVS